jgi:hypothetical protein
MTRLRPHVSIAGRFQRSIRIDTDIGDANALDGFICPPSSTELLLTMARQIAASGHAAFTWTGPYGAGKSSLALGLCAALSSKQKLREAATRALGVNVARELSEAFRLKATGFRAVPIIGRRAPLSTLIGEALEQQGLVRKPSRGWSDASVLDQLSTIATQQPKSHCGLLVIIDELGKVLEGAAHESADIYLLQQLAELANRSERRLVIVGVLHQAFDEYAQRLAREVRDEWAKIQGRFVDLVVNASGDEQIEMLARAIEVGGKITPPREISTAVAAVMRPAKAAEAKRLSDMLCRCWPLHPVVAALLGPLSRRRFGQNQRSLFAFLNSAEPHAFHDFLQTATSTDLYQPDRLWDYLRVNLEPAILASPDGHRWSIGVDALERCTQASGSPLSLILLKSIILIDLFRERSGLAATAEVVQHCAPAGTSPKELNAALKHLTERSCIVYRRHLSAYALYAGSDFDIDEAMHGAMPPAATIDPRRLRTMAGVQPLMAKRHYHATGAIRWFNLEFVRLSELKDACKEELPQPGPAGRFLIAIPTQGEAPDAAKKICSTAAAGAPEHIVVGLSQSAWHVTQLAQEFLALTAIHDERPELRGDAVARREVIARLQAAQAKLEGELQRIADTTTWYRHGDKPAHLTADKLNALASRIADERYHQAPKILNELLNRDFPSSNAVKAQKDLLKRMLDSAGQPRLGLDGWPAEAGLLQSILVESGLYSESRTGEWQFQAPTSQRDPSGIYPLWQAGLDFLREKSDRSVSLSDLYGLWVRAPYGVKSGLLPILAVTLFITQRTHLAIYRHGVFQPDMTDLDVDLLTSDPSQVQMRWMEISPATRTILKGLHDVVVGPSKRPSAADETPLEIARRLVGTFHALPGWTKKTTTLSQSTQRLASILRYAADPNRLLFDDLPKLAEQTHGNSGKPDVIAVATRAFEELKLAYPRMLSSLHDLMLAELEARSGAAGLEALRHRAANLQQTTGDLRLNAFISRLAVYSGSEADIEGIAGLANEKRPTDWVDADIDDAKQRIAELVQAFKLREEVARVSGGTDTRHRMAVIVPRDGTPRAYHTEFVVNAHDADEIAAIITKLDAALSRADTKRQNIILAALAQLSARYMKTNSSAPPRVNRRTG